MEIRAVLESLSGRPGAEAINACREGDEAVRSHVAILKRKHGELLADVWTGHLALETEHDGKLLHVSMHQIYWANGNDMAKHGSLFHNRPKVKVDEGIPSGPPGGA